MAERICTVPGCEMPTRRIVKGMCENHYARWRRNGDPGSAGPHQPSLCSITDCGSLAIARGWCNAHYRRWRRNGDPAAGRIIGDDEARFWSHVDRDGPVPAHRPDLGPCWLWTGSLNGDGYGNFGVDGQVRGAHRWAYMHFVGPIPDGHEPDHLCRNRACVNYERHLDPVPRAENIRRAVATRQEKRAAL